jgi:IS605 OrfB family transposase
VQLVEHAHSGIFNVRVRLPNPCEKEHGKYASFELQIRYGLEEIRIALREKRAITWKFKVEEKGVRAFFTIRSEHLELQLEPGSIGVDFNHDHFAVIEVDGFGNLLPKTQMRLPLAPAGSPTGMSATYIGNAVQEIVKRAKKTKKQIVIEDLDFSKKRAELRENGAHPEHARMLTGLSVAKFKANLIGVASRAGIPVIEVNPAFTSLIGRIKLAKPKGLAIHTAAAGVIARRGQRNTEKPLKGLMEVSSYLGQVAFESPVRKMNKHVWTWWKAVRAVYRKQIECLKKTRADAWKQARVTAKNEDDFIPGLEPLRAASLVGAGT